MRPRWGDNHELKVVTVNIPRIFLRYIEALRIKGICPSRSEYIRRAVGEQVLRDFEMIYNIENIDELPIENIEFEYDEEKYVRIPGYNGGKPFKTVRLE